MISELTAENDKLEEQENTKQNNHDQLQRWYDGLESQHKAFESQAYDVDLTICIPRECEPQYST
jgi:hypothetical protein